MPPEFATPAPALCVDVRIQPLCAAAGSPGAESGGAERGVRGGVRTGEGVTAAALARVGRSLHACSVFQLLIHCS